MVTPAAAQGRTEPPASADAGTPASVEVTLSRGEFVGDRGNLDPERMDTALRVRLDRLRACYETALRSTPALAGRLGVQLAVAPTGRVTDVWATGLPENPAFSTCVSQTFRAATLPSPGARPIRYRLTLTLGMQAPPRSATTSIPVARMASQTAATGVSRDAIRRVVSMHRSDVAACHEYAQQRNPSLEGQIVIRFTIAPDGSVSNAEVAECAGDLESAGECIANRLRAWTFPAPEGGSSETTTYPFNLSPAL